MPEAPHRHTQHPRASFSFSLAFSSAFRLWKQVGHLAPERVHKPKKNRDARMPSPALDVRDRLLIDAGGIRQLHLGKAPALP